MQYKITDYAILTKSLQILCKRLDCEFVDFPIEFKANIEDAEFTGKAFICDTNGTFLTTAVAVYALYVHNLDKIVGRNIDNLEYRNSLIVYFLTLVNDFAIEYKSKRQRDPSQQIYMKLDQFHVVWMLLKNLICPYKNLELKNIKILAQNAACYDAAKMIELENETICFVNLDIEKSSVRSAFLLVESLRIILKDRTESSESVIREMFTNFFMKDKLIDFLGMAFGENSDISNFLAVLSILCQSQEIENMAVSLKSNVKTAQSNPYTGNWWFLGLTEKMLESVRGPDFSTTIMLKDFSKELWEKVEKERKARGLVELPFELLLRIQSRDLATPPNQTLQQLLSKSRIW
jgi:hypothetical protein